MEVGTQRESRVVTLTNDGGERTHSSLTRPVAPPINPVKRRAAK